MTKSSVEKAGRIRKSPKRVLNVLVAFLCSVTVGAGMLIVPSDVAYAESIREINGVYEGQSDAPTDGFTISINFGHNVSHTDYIGANASCISMKSEDGSTVAISVYSNFSGTNPGAGNEDLAGERRWLRVNVPALEPGTAYTLTIKSGIRSSGGHSYDGRSVTFTTAGEKEKPPERPDPPKPTDPPEPTDPPDQDGKGSGGNGTNNGSNNNNGNNEHSGDGGLDSDDLNEDDGGSVPGGLDDGGSDYGDGNSSRPRDSIEQSSNSDTGISEIAVETKDSITQSNARSASIGSATAYLVKKTGHNFGAGQRQASGELSGISTSLMLGLALIAVGIALFGMIKRALMWHKRRTA